MRYILLFPLLFLGCSTKAPESKSPTYRDCIAKQDQLRETRFKEMPSALQPLAGKHTVVKYYEKRPKNLASIVSGLQKENATFNARKKKDAENDLDLRLLDTSPGRNRVLIGFEKKDESLVLKMDYSKPVIGYYFPLSALKEKGKGFEGKYSSSVKLKAPKSYTGDKTIGKMSFSVYLEPITKEYMYMEWVNHAYDPADDPNWRGLHAILFTGDDDRFLDWEHPYFDSKGELNPEDCNSLPGG